MFGIEATSSPRGASRRAPRVKFNEGSTMLEHVVTDDAAELALGEGRHRRVQVKHQHAVVLTHGDLARLLRNIDPGDLHLRASSLWQPKRPW